jgi:hypothetical protein
MNDKESAQIDDTTEQIASEGPGRRQKLDEDKKR